MLKLPNAPLTTQEGFEAHLAQAPLALRSLKTKAWERYNKLQAPGKESAHWRFAKQNPFARLHTFGTPQVHTGNASGPSEQEPCTRITFLNGVFCSTPLPSYITPFATNLSQDASALFQRAAESPVEGDSEKLYALHLAYVEQGLLIKIPQGLTLPAPIVVETILSEDQGSYFPHIRICAGQGSTATVVHLVRYLDSAKHTFYCGCTHIEAASGSNLRYYTTCHQASPDAVHIQMESCHLAEGARIDCAFFTQGDSYTRHSIGLHLDGPRAEATIQCGTRRTRNEHDLRVLQYHHAPDTRSKFLAKHALAGTAHSITAGLIQIDADCAHCEASQRSDHLMLSAEASATAWPALEVQTNDVQCAHGSTIHPIDPESLFYLQARGVPTDEAIALLTAGFLDTAISKAEPFIRPIESPAAFQG